MESNDFFNDKNLDFANKTFTNRMVNGDYTFLFNRNISSQFHFQNTLSSPKPSDENVSNIEEQGFADFNDLPIQNDDEEYASNIPIQRTTEDDVISHNISRAVPESMEYSNITGVIAGSINSSIMNSFSASATAQAAAGKGPNGNAFNAENVAQQTAANKSTATEVAGAALGIGGMFGPEGLIAGGVIAGGIDIAEATGAFDQSDSVASTAGYNVDPSS
jgi:hypothetical protein